jgi:hypothetical protein
MIEVPYINIALAGLVSVIIGFIWYHPRVFGGAWMRLTGITPESVEAGKKRMPFVAACALIASMLVAYVMYFVAYGWNIFDVIGAVELAIWVWIGFIVPVLLGMVLWEGKSITLYFIHIGYWLVSLITMAVVVVF